MVAKLGLAVWFPGHTCLRVGALPQWKQWPPVLLRAKFRPEQLRNNKPESNRKCLGTVYAWYFAHVSCAKVCLQVLASLLPSSSASPNCTASKVAASSDATSVAATREATRTSSSPTTPSSSWSGIVGREATSKTVSVGNKFGCFFQTECGRFF